MADINFQSLDPSERDWEYDGDGTRIYKPGKYDSKTIYKDEYEIWKKRFGHDWEPISEEYKGEEEPYYVDLP